MALLREIFAPTTCAPGAWFGSFTPSPIPGEPGYDTWPKDAWKYGGGTNCWGEMSLDEKTGIVYIPTGAPVYDFYGADRKGNNLFADSLIALNARTGKVGLVLPACSPRSMGLRRDGRAPIADGASERERCPIVAQAMQARVSFTSSTARRASQSGRLRSVRCRNPICRRSRLRPRSLFRQAAALRAPVIHGGGYQSLYPEPGGSSAMEEGGGECRQPGALHPSGVDRHDRDAGQPWRCQLGHDRRRSGQWDDVRGVHGYSRDPQE